jgi:hypothetical protein
VGLVHLPFYSFSYTNVLPKSPKGNITVTELGPSFSAGYSIKTAKFGNSSIPACG